MKTPEQWLEEFSKQGVGLGWAGWMLHASERDKYYFKGLIRDIQADAYDEGVRVMYEKVSAKLGVSSEN